MIEMRRWFAQFISFPHTRRSLTFFRVSAVLFPALTALLLDRLRAIYFPGINPLAWSLVLFLAVVLVSLLFIRVVIIVADNLQQENTRRVHELATLNELSQTLDMFHNLTALLKPAMEKLLQVTRSDIAELYLANEQSHELTHALHLGPMEDLFAAEVTENLRDRLVRANARFNEHVLVGETNILPGGPFPAVENSGVRSAALIPLKSMGGTVGVIALFSRGRDHYRAGESGLLLNLGSRIALAIEKARLYEKVQAVAVLEERERISAELHDGLAQVLGYVITKSQATRQLLRKMTEANDYLVELENVAQEVYTDTREAILGLRTAISGNRSMVSAIREYALRFNQMHNIRTELVTGDAIIPSLPPQVELQAIRIVQEALSNIRKHAKATRANIKVSAVEGSVVIVVEDDGKGFDMEKHERLDWTKFGLRNMKDRAESINGVLSIDSRLDKGTTITLKIPLNLVQNPEKKGEEIASTDRR